MDPIPLTTYESTQLFALALLLSIPSVLLVLLVASWLTERGDRNG